MSADFVSINVFRDSLESLCKKEKYGYSSCIKDIENVFKDLTFDQIWDLHTRLIENGDVRVIKVRIPNSGQNLSKSDGFRLIILCNKKYKHIALLNVYAKRGKLAQLDQAKEQTKYQVSCYAKNLKESSLVVYKLGEE